jgi:hypothetical protein
LSAFHGIYFLFLRAKSIYYKVNSLSQSPSILIGFILSLTISILSYISNAPKLFELLQLGQGRRHLRRPSCSACCVRSVQRMLSSSPSVLSCLTEIVMLMAGEDLCMPVSNLSCLVCTICLRELHVQSCAIMHRSKAYCICTCYLFTS